MINRNAMLQLAVLVGSGLAVGVLTLLIPAWVQAQNPPGDISTAAASINFQKTPDNQVVLSEEDAVFTLMLENTGSVSLTLTDIPEDPFCDDPNFLSGFSGDDNVNSLIDPGETWTVNCTVSNVTVDFTNVATVTVAPVATLTDQIEASDDATVDVINPSIDVQKTPDTQTVSSGPVNFTITVENTGDADLTNIQVVDDTCAPVTGPSGDNGDGKLNPAEIWTYSCTVSTVQESFVNIVTVTGTPPIGPDAQDSDSAQVLLQDTVNTCTIPGGPPLLAYWKLDESTPGSPINYDDFYGGHDGNACPGGNCPTSTQGRLNNAQQFDGSSTGIDVDIPGANAFNWGANDSFSIEFWMKSDPGSCTQSGIPNNEVMVGRDDPATDLHWWVGCHNQTGVAAFNLKDESDNGVFLKGTTPINDGQWHHIVAIRNGSANSNYLYVDAVQEVSDSFNYPNGFTSDSAELNIGWLDLSVGFHFQGTLDEIAIYDGVLGADIITDHYNNKQGSFSPDYCTGHFPPEIYTNPVINTVIDEVYNYDVDAYGEPPPTYTLTLAPSGMEIISSTGVISWTPTITQQVNIIVEASNSEGDDTQEFILNVSSSPSGKVLLPIIIKNN